MIEIDYISGYNIDIIRKEEIKKLNKKKLLTKLEEKNLDIKEELKKVLENNGVLVCLIKRGIIYAINIFENNHELKELKLIKTIVTEQVDKITTDKFNVATENIAENMLSIEEFNGVETVKIKGKIIKPNEKKVREEEAIVIALCCLTFGIIFDQLLIGLLCGMMFGLLIYHSDNIIIKTSNKKEKENKKDQENKE